MIYQDWRVKLANFTLSKSAKSPSTLDESNLDSSFTNPQIPSKSQTSTVSKSNPASGETDQDEELNWWAPEILRGESHTKASDIYSFGMMLYEMLCGEVPYGGRSQA